MEGNLRTYIHPYQIRKCQNCGKGSFTVCPYFTPPRQRTVGLISGFWMSDKPLVQQRLATDLAELLLLINPVEEEARLEAALGFLAGFWESMVREWIGLDRLRYVYLLLSKGPLCSSVRQEKARENGE